MGAGGNFCSGPMRLPRRAIGNGSVEQGSRLASRAWPGNRSKTRGSRRTGAGFTPLCGGGGVWSSTDLGLTWHRAERADADYPAHLELGETVDGSALVVRNPYRAAVSYALGEHLYRSDDGGSEWTNLTALGGESVIGRWQSVLAISPADADVIVVGNSMGLWKSHDAGVSWGSLNGNLPNFPSARFLGTQAAGAPLLAAAPLGTLELIRTASGLTWRASSARQFGPADIPATERTAPDRTAATLPAGYAVSYRVWRDGRPISPDLTRCAPSEPCPGHAISAFAIGGQLWSGTSNGRIWGSPDGGGNWELAWSDPAAGAVTSIWADSARPSTALAVVGGRVLRSTNGGASWFDIGSGLPGSDWSLVQGHPEADSVYVGGPRGVYFARAELSRPAPVGVWVGAYRGSAGGRRGGSRPRTPARPPVCSACRLRHLLDARASAGTGTAGPQLGRFGTPLGGTGQPADDHGHRGSPGPRRRTNGADLGRRRRPDAIASALRRGGQFPAPAAGLS